MTMDIGNSIFNCGQVYITLSRVTSLEELYLINYDPSSITANEEAIIEYNQLRQTRSKNDFCFKKIILESKRCEHCQKCIDKMSLIKLV